MPGGRRVQCRCHLESPPLAGRLQPMSPRANGAKSSRRSARNEAFEPFQKPSKPDLYAENRLPVGFQPCSKRAVRPTRIATERLKLHIRLVESKENYVRPTRIATERLKLDALGAVELGQWVRPTRIATERLKHC